MAAEDHASSGVCRAVPAEESDSADPGRFALDICFLKALAWLEKGQQHAMAGRCGKRKRTANDGGFLHAPRMRLRRRLVGGGILSARMVAAEGASGGRRNSASGGGRGCG